MSPKKKDDAVSSEVSFLDETQKEGKATGKVELSDLDQAIASVHKIMDEDAATMVRETKEDELPTADIVVYSHELREIVPAGIGYTKRGNPRIVCGKTGSKKISVGRAEALHKFYHLDKDGKKPVAEGTLTATAAMENAPKPKPKPPRRRRKRR